MSNLERRPGSRPSRKEREGRAYQLVLAGGTFGALAVVGLVLAVVGIIGAGWPLLSAAIAAICFWLFRRTVS